MPRLSIRQPIEAAASPCRVKTPHRRSQRCTLPTSLPRSKLFLKNGAGGVHDQLWQKSAVEEMEEIVSSRIFPSCAPSFPSWFQISAFLARFSLALTISLRSARILKAVRNGQLVVSPKTVGLWRSWERASMAWKRSSVRSRPGPPNLPTLLISGAMRLHSPDALESRLKLLALQSAIIASNVWTLPALA